MRHPKHQMCPVPLAYSPFTRENLRSCCSALFFFSNTGNGKAIGLKISRCCKGCTVLSCGDVKLGDARPLGKFVPEFPSTAPVLQLYAQQSPRPSTRDKHFALLLHNQVAPLPGSLRSKMWLWASHLSVLGVNSMPREHEQTRVEMKGSQKPHVESPRFSESRTIIRICHLSCRQHHAQSVLGHAAYPMNPLPQQNKKRDQRKELCLC